MNLEYAPASFGPSRFDVLRTGAARLTITACLCLIAGIVAAYFAWRIRGWDQFGETPRYFAGLVIISSIPVLAAAFIFGILGLVDSYYFRRSLLALLIVWTLAITCAEVACGIDEADFRAEAAAKEPHMAPGQTIFRQRAWPNESSDLGFTKGKGFFATD